MVGWYILLVASCVLFVTIQFVILPKIVATLRYGNVAPRGRGCRIIKESAGKSIVYDAASDMADTIPQYILSERNGKKVLVCKLNDSVRTIDYDVALFDKNGEIFNVLNVREKVGRVGYAREVALPAETEYVSIYLNAADGERRGNGAPSGKIPKVRLLIYVSAFIASVFLCVWLMRIGIAHVFGGVFDESFLADWNMILNIFYLCLIVVALDVIIALVLLKVKNKGKKGRKSRGGI